MMVTNCGRRACRASRLHGELPDSTGGDATWLLVGEQLGGVAADAAKYAPAHVVDSPALSRPLAAPLARTIATVARQHKFDLVCAAASTFAKDCLPRAAAALGGAMASDVTRHELVDGRLELDSPHYAGAVTVTLRLIGSPQIVTVRASAYPAAEAGPDLSRSRISRWTPPRLLAAANTKASHRKRAPVPMSPRPA